MIAIDDVEWTKRIIFVLANLKPAIGAPFFFSNHFEDISSTFALHPVSWRESSRLARFERIIFRRRLESNRTLRTLFGRNRNVSLKTETAAFIEKGIRIHTRFTVVFVGGFCVV